MRKVREGRVRPDDCVRHANSFDRGRAWKMVSFGQMICGGELFIVLTRIACALEPKIWLFERKAWNGSLMNGAQSCGWRARNFVVILSRRYAPFFEAAACFSCSLDAATLFLRLCSVLSAGFACALCGQGESLRNECFDPHPARRREISARASEGFYADCFSPPICCSWGATSPGRCADRGPVVQGVAWESRELDDRTGDLL